MRILIFYLLMAFITFLFFITLHENIIIAQSDRDLSNSNIKNFTSSSINITSEINMQKLMDDYKAGQRAESEKPLVLRDFEADIDSFISGEELKAAIDKSKKAEAPLDFDNIVNIEPDSILKLESNTSNNLTNKAKQTENITQNIVISKYNINSWEGSDIINNEFIGIPPDIDLAVGPNHVIQAVHQAIKVWNKNGKLIGTSTLSDFFGDSKNKLSDPLIKYDASSKRWISVIMDIPEKRGSPTCQPRGCSILLSISENENPLGNWKIIPINFKLLNPPTHPTLNVFVDFPQISIDNQNIILSVNNFDKKFINSFKETTKFKGIQLIVINKESLFSNSTKIPIYYSKNDNTRFTLYPSQSPQPNDCSIFVTNPPLLTIRSSEIHKICGNPSKSNFIYEIFSVPITRSELAVPNNQPDGNKFIVEIDNRIITAVNYNNSLWYGFSSACDNPERLACSHLVKVDLKERKVLDERFVSVENNNVIYPVIMTNKNGIMTFAATIYGKDYFPSVLLSDEDFDEHVLIKEGLRSYVADRWGDYFGSSPDPSDGSVWVSLEYANQLNSELPLPEDPEVAELLKQWYWSTIVANIK